MKCELCNKSPGIFYWNPHLLFVCGKCFERLMQEKIAREKLSKDEREVK